MPLESGPAYTDGMRSTITSSFIAIALAACGDDAPGETTAVTTIITTATLGTSAPATSTDTDGSTSTSMSTTGTQPTTTDAETTDGSTTSTTSEPPAYCIDDGDDATSPPPTCIPVAEEWCDEVGVYAAEYLPEVYAEVAVANCESHGESDPCATCFYIAHTCTQVAGPCDFDAILYECGCLARAHGLI